MDVGAFVRGDNSYAIAKCSIKNNSARPKTVSDLKLAINILDSELISPILHVHDSSATLLKSIASEEILKYLEQNIERINRDLLNSGKDEISEGESILKKIALLDKYVEQDKSGSEKQFDLIAQHILEAIDKIPKTVAEINPISLRENVNKILEDDGIRNRGYNSAVNMLTTVLDGSKMGYQHVENHRNSRMCKIEEYSDENRTNLPDENYTIYLNYYDIEQIKSMRRTYEKKFKQFQENFNEALALLEEKYSRYKREADIIDYTDILDEMQVDENRPPEVSFFEKFFQKKDVVETRKKVKVTEEEEEDLTWSEFRFIRPNENDKIKQYRKFESEIKEIKEKLLHMETRLQEIYRRSFPDERILISERLDTLIDRFNAFSGKVNPFQLQPGLCLEINITSVKRKKTTIMSMANVLNEFLHSTSKGFADAAFASFQRRRSTVRTEDMDDFTSHHSEKEGSEV
jgi:hypothetical protein